MHEHPVKRLFDEFRELGAAHAHEPSKDIKVGADITVQSNVEGDDTALHKMLISKGNPMWQKGISEAEARMYPCVTSMLHCRHRCKARTCKKCTGGHTH